MDLRPLLDAVTEVRPFRDFMPSMHQDLTGHEHVFVLGTAAGRELVIQCGRRHLYQGFSFDETVQPVDVLYNLGARTVVLTNAVGGIAPELGTEDWVAADCVRAWPYRGSRLPEEQKPEWRLPGIRQAGTYQWMHGPCYETRAEIKALKGLGVATVGMSVAPELVQCTIRGMSTAVVSCVTNVCGDGRPLTHGHVVETARRGSQTLCRLLRNAMETREA